jgi:hypothetical protein
LYNYVHDFLDGGLMDAVPRPDRRAWAYVDDEGLLKGLPVNSRLSRLLSRLIVGPGVVFRPPTGDGDETSVPEDLIRLLEQFP